VRQDTCKLGDVERAELRSRTVTEALAEAEAELLRDDVHRLGNENKRLERELNTALTRLQLSQQSLQEVQAVFMCNSSMSPPRSPSGPDSPALRLADNEEQGKGDGPGVEKLQQDLIQAKLAVAELATDDTKLKRRVAELEKMLAHTKYVLVKATEYISIYVCTRCMPQHHMPHNPDSLWPLLQAEPRTCQTRSRGCAL
jgi:hypothetical protein